MFDKQKPNNSDNATQGNTYSQNAAPAPQPRASAVIGATIKIKGEVSGDENLIIEGKVEGTVNLGTKHVTVGQSGNVQANIEAQVIKVDGEVKGDMSGKEKVIISKTGRVQGNIVSPRVTLEDGAKFKGSIDMDPNENGAVTPIKPAAKTVGEEKKDGPGQPAKNL